MVNYAHNIGEKASFISDLSSSGYIVRKNICNGK